VKQLPAFNAITQNQVERVVPNALARARHRLRDKAIHLRRSIFFRDHKVATFPIHILDSCLPDSKIQVTDSAFNAIRQNQVERLVPNALLRGQASPSEEGDPPSSFDFFTGLQGCYFPDPHQPFLDSWLPDSTIHVTDSNGRFGSR
jgi:hypothetical protein